MSLESDLDYGYNPFVSFDFRSRGLVALFFREGSCVIPEMKKQELIGALSLSPRRDFARRDWLGSGSQT
jgi:hypothetical protein